MSQRIQSKTNSLYPPLIAIILLLIGISYLNTLTTLKIKDLGHSSLLAGILFSSYFSGIFLGSFATKPLIRAKGHVPAYVYLTISTSIMILLQSISHVPGLWLLFRFLTGFCVSGVFIIIESTLLCSSQTSRGRTLSYYLLAIYFADALGQFGPTIMPLHGYTPILFIACISISSILPMLHSSRGKTISSSHTYIKEYTVIKKAPLACLGVLSGGLLLGSFFSMGPIYANGITKSNLDAAMMIIIPIFGGVFMQWPLGKISDRFDKKQVLIIQCLLLCLASYKCMQIDGIFYPFLYGAVAFTIYPVSVAYCCEFFPTNDYTSISSTILKINSLGFILGPILSASCMQHLGLQGFYYFTMVIEVSVLVSSIFYDRGNLRTSKS